MILVLYSSQKIGFDISCELSLGDNLFLMNIGFGDI